MVVPKFMLEERGMLVEVVSQGHFPNTVMIHNYHTNQLYEVDFARLQHLPKNKDIDTFAREL